MSKANVIQLTSRFDGRTIAALSAKADGARRGGVVVIQEIFGLSDHIAEICEVVASWGYDAIAPGLFERIEPQFSAGLTPDGFQKGIAAVQATPWPQAMGDVQAAVDALEGPRFVAGFCYGGAAAWRAAGECDNLSGASCFYGRLIVNMLDIKPRCPVMLHYGANDASIPQEDVARVRAAAPEAQIFVYDAGHGFCRKASHDYNDEARSAALARTHDFFNALSA